MWLKRTKKEKNRCGPFHVEILLCRSGCVPNMALTACVELSICELAICELAICESVNL